MFLLSLIFFFLKSVKNMDALVENNTFDLLNNEFFSRQT